MPVPAHIVAGRGDEEQTYGWTSEHEIWIRTATPHGRGTIVSFNTESGKVKRYDRLKERVETFQLQFPDPPGLYNVRVSANGRWIAATAGAFVGPPEAMVVGSTDGTHWMVNPGPRRLIGADTPYTWLANGKTLAYLTSGRTGSAMAFFDATHPKNYRRVDLTLGGWTPVIDTFRPSVLLKERLCLLLRRDRKGAKGPSYRIADISSLRGDQPKTFAVTLPRDSELVNAAQSPDGGKIAWMLARQPTNMAGSLAAIRYELWMSRSNGTQLEFVGRFPPPPPGTGLGGLAWKPSGNYVTYLAAKELLSVGLR